MKARNTVECVKHIEEKIRSYNMEDDYPDASQMAVDIFNICKDHWFPPEQELND